MLEEEQGATPEEVVIESDSQMPETDAGETKIETDEERNARLAAEAAEKARQRAERKQSRINERFAELTAEKRAAEAREQAAAAREAKLLEMLQGQKPANVNGEPTRDQFDQYEDYVVARAEWRAEQKASQLAERQLAEYRQRQQMEQTQSQQRAMAAEFAKRIQTARAEIPDFAEVVEDADIQIPNTVASLIAQLDNGPQIMYHLAKNPALAQQFDALPPALHAYKLGEIATALKSQSQVSKAPPPGKPAAARTASGNEPPEDPDAYMDWARKHMR